MILTRQDYKNGHVIVVEIFHKEENEKKRMCKEYMDIPEEKKQKRKEHLRNYLNARKSNKLID